MGSFFGLTTLAQLLLVLSRSELLLLTLSGLTLLQKLGFGAAFQRSPEAIARLTDRGFFTAA